MILPSSRLAIQVLRLLLRMRNNPCPMKRVVKMARARFHSRPAGAFSQLLDGRPGQSGQIVTLSRNRASTPLDRSSIAQPTVGCSLMCGPAPRSGDTAAHRQRSGLLPRVLHVTLGLEAGLGETARSTVRIAAAQSEYRAAGEFDAWARASGPALLRFARALSANPHDAADDTQDALVAVYLRWDRLTRTGSPDAYARRVILNRRISWWRKVGRRERAVGVANVDYLDGPSLNDPAADDLVVARDLLRSLPARQRAAVELRYYDDLGFGEIADILGCRESTARSYVHRALERLREQLRDSDD